MIGDMGGGGREGASETKDRIRMKEERKETRTEKIEGGTKCVTKLVR